jgi:chlorite dismutase
MPERTTEPRRQVVSFSFYKVQPEWRRLAQQEKAEHRGEFGSIIGKWRNSEQMTVLTYSLAGLRAGADIMLWRICYSLECLQQMQAELTHTRLGSFLETPHSFLAMTRRSQYKIGHGNANEYVDAIGDFPRVRMNTLYSFGIDDQEFVLVFESDSPADIVDLKMRLRETENATYIQQDTPVFTGIQCDTDKLLEQLG